MFNTLMYFSSFFVFGHSVLVVVSGSVRRFTSAYIYVLVCISPYTHTYHSTTWSALHLSYGNSTFLF